MDRADSAVGRNGQAANRVADLSGLWERTDEVGGGSIGGLNEKIFPKASLKPEIVKENQENAARQQRGDVAGYGSKWCLTGSYPSFMQDAAAWDLFQTQDEIVQVPELRTSQGTSIWTEGLIPMRRI